MKSQEVKTSINKSKKKIVEIMGNFFPKEYKNDIANRIDKTNILVWDSEYKQKERLASVELPNIAAEFAKDITLDLKLSKETKVLLGRIIGNIIFEASNKEKDLKKFIKEEVSKTKLLNEKINFYTNEIINLVEYYKNDEEVNYFLKIINDKETPEDKVTKEMEEHIKTTLELKFRYKTNDKQEMLKVWGYIMDQAQDLFEDIDEEIYLILGLKGNNLSQLKRSAKKLGIVFDKSLAYNLIDRFNNQLKYVVNTYLSKYDNNNEIVASLKGGYSIEIANEAIYNLTHNKILDFDILKSGKTKTIIFNNNSYLYSKDGVKTIIKAFLKNISVLPLNIKELANNDKYNLFYETLIEYFSSELANEYILKYGEILPIYVKTNDKQDKNIELINKVYNKYQEKILNDFFDNKLNDKELLNRDYIKEFNKLVKNNKK